MGGRFMNYNLRGDTKDYLKLDEESLNILFQKYSRFKIHLALGGVKNYYHDEGTTEQRRQLFKKKLTGNLSTKNNINS